MYSVAQERDTEKPQGGTAKSGVPEIAQRAVRPTCRKEKKIHSAICLIIGLRARLRGGRP